MTIDLVEYNDLKKKAEKLKSQADRAQGALEQHMKQLKDEFHCESIEEGEKALRKLKKLETETAEKYEVALEAFKEEWGEKLEEI